MAAWWNRIETWLIGILGAAGLAMGGYQIFGRYIDPKLAAPWADEVVVYIIVWAVFLAASQLVRTDGHVRPDLIMRMLSPGTQRVLEIFNSVLALVFCLGLLWCGVWIVNDSLGLGERSSTVLQFPMWIYYLALPVGAFLMSVRYAIRLYQYVWRFDPATMTIGHVVH